MGNVHYQFYYYVGVIKHIPIMINFITFLSGPAGICLIIGHFLIIAVLIYGLKHCGKYIYMSCTTPVED